MKKTLQKVLAIVMVLTMLFSQMAIMSSAFESEIASVTIVADGKLIENYDGYWDDEWDEETGEYINEYFYYDAECAVTDIIITLNDGSVISEGEMGYYFNDAEVVTDQSYDNQWGVGTHNATAVLYSVDGKEFVCEFQVEIIENPVENVDVEEVELIEKTNGWWLSSFDEETGEYIENSWYMYTDIPNSLYEYTITLKDGTVIESENGYVECYGRRFTINTVIDELQYDEHWLVGNTYSAHTRIIGFEFDLNITIVETPVASVDVAPITVIEEYDGWWNEDYDWETEEVYSWFYYGYENCMSEYTVTLKDGTVLESDEFGNIYYNGICYEEEYFDTQYEEHWGLGTHNAIMSVLGFDTEIEVNVIEHPIISITAIAQNSLVEGYHGYWETEWDYENDCEVEYFRYSPNHANLIFTVTYKDGSVFTGDDNEIYDQTGYWPDTYYSQTYDNQWSVGTNECRIGILGVEGTCEIEVVENPVESITAVAQNTLIENTGGYWTTDWDEENNCETEEYYYYEVYNANLLYTVTYKDGRVFTGDYWDIYYATGYHIGNYSNQSYENQWTLGKNETSFEILGVEGTCEIEIVEHPIESVTAVAQKDLIVHGDGYWNSEYNDETGNWDLEYFEYSVNSADILITVTMKDGTVYTGDRWEIEEATGFSTYLYNDQSYYNQWDIGEHEVTICVDDIECVATVNVVESPVESITAVANRGLIQYADGGWNGTWDDGMLVDKYYDYDASCAELEYTVTYKDGTVFTGDAWDIYEQTGYDIYYSSNQEFGNEWGLGKHTITIAFLGVESEVEVNVVESPVKKVTVDKVEIVEETLGYWYMPDEDYVFNYNIDPEYTVELKDGTKLRSENGFIEYEGYTYYLDVDTGNEPLAVGEHQLNANVLGGDCVVNVEILETPIESITVTPSRDLIQGVDYYTFHEQLLDYNATITYKDGRIETGKLSDFENKYYAEILYYDGFLIDDDYYDPELLGEYSMPIRFMGVDSEVEINIIENPYESVTISGENELYLTLKKKDGTIVNAKAYGYEDDVWAYVHDGCNEDGIIKTDKGNFYIGINYDWQENNKDVSICLGDIESNTLETNNFFASYYLFERVIFSIGLQSAYAPNVYGYEFNGYSSDNVNVDDVIGLSVYMTNYAFEGNEFYNGFYGVAIKVEDVEELVYEKFGIEIDATQAEFYDADEGLVYVPTPMGFGDMYGSDCYVTCDGEFVNGQWVYVETVTYYSGKVETTTVVFNEDLTIAKISLDSTEEVREGWVEENGKWAYYENGVKLTNQWKKDSKGWCYLGADGYMATNKWIKDSQGWCYVGDNGYCVTNTWKKDSKGWCYLDANGRMATNKWIKDSQGWCYVDGSGYCATNTWKKDSKGWVYLDASGRMVTNKWVKDSKGWCYVGADGYAVTNCWKKDSKGWCYLDENGSMTKNEWVKDGGKWYYLDGNGYMVTGTKKIGGKTYKFNSSGVWVG